MKEMINITQKTITRKEGRGARGVNIGMEKRYKKKEVFFFIAFTQYNKRAQTFLHRPGPE
jgi:hypothetical protein